jgi:diacylglycerol kinase (ATP)
MSLPESKVQSLPDVVQAADHTTQGTLRGHDRAAAIQDRWPRGARMERQDEERPQPRRTIQAIRTLSLWAISLWKRARALFERRNIVRARTVARAGQWTLRFVRARRAVGSYAPLARALAERTRDSLGLVFTVLAAQSWLPGAPQLDVRAFAERRYDAAWRPPGTPRARIIANPTSGSIRGAEGLRELRATAIWLTEHGLPTELALTEAAGHASELARECAQAGMEMVIAAGGDGTINDVAQGLAGTATALGVLPLGTMNVWARETGIPLSLPDARKLLLDGARQRVDLGRAGARYFLLMAGIGFDAEVVRRVEGNWLKRWGLKFLDYLLTAGMLGFTQQPARLWRRTDGKRRSTRALMVVIGNTRLHAGTLVFAHKAVIDDGQLDVVIIGGGGLIHRARVIGHALLRRPSPDPRVRYEHCRGIRLESSPPLPVQVDGELIGHLPMTFSVVPAALTVIVPHDAPQSLFSRPPEQ